MEDNDCKDFKEFYENYEADFHLVLDDNQMLQLTKKQHKRLTAAGHAHYEKAVAYHIRLAEIARIRSAAARHVTVRSEEAAPFSDAAIRMVEATSRYPDGMDVDDGPVDSSSGASSLTANDQGMICIQYLVFWSCQRYLRFLVFKENNSLEANADQQVATVPVPKRKREAPSAPSDNSGPITGQARVPTAPSSRCVGAGGSMAAASTVGSMSSRNTDAMDIEDDAAVTGGQVSVVAAGNQGMR